ncbi:hypothetical protein DSO57_1007537 [Entomophthora muscae]|uniref:Uncharacterized protein n=1 Tax=Entomophthora muscae TaxID=34485 RepID=A0ACC2UTN6_9FUNG|nr:hypothetical protein DSO57_1007537 [Entomophthora muscae]
MHPMIGLLQYILYNLILNQIISGRWSPVTGTLLLVPPNVNFMPANFAAPPPILETGNCIPSQCPEFYAEDALMLSQVIYLGLLWLGLIVLLNPGVTIGNFTKKYLKPCWWLIINSMWIWVYGRKATTLLLLGSLLSSDKAIDSDDHIKNLVNCIIDIQATAYTSVYKTNILELSPDNARRSLLPEFYIGDHVTYYQHRVRGHAHKLDTLWVGPLDATFKCGSEYTVKLLSSSCLFS